MQKKPSTVMGKWAVVHVVSESGGGQLGARTLSLEAPSPTEQWPGVDSELMWPVTSRVRGLLPAERVKARVTVHRS